jgi:hypothetical protein
MQRKLILTVLGLTTVAGCGTPPKGMEILVDTAPPGASCVLSRGGQPIATAEPTPAIAVVPIDTAPVLAQCRRPGFADAEAVVPPGVPPSYPWLGYPITEYRSAVTLIMTPHFAALPR